MIYETINVKQLSPEEIEVLKKSILGYGKLASASRQSGVSNQTIYNAINGDKLGLNTLNSIRTYLKSIVNG